MSTASRSFGDSSGGYEQKGCIRINTDGTTSKVQSIHVQEPSSPTGTCPSTPNRTLGESIDNTAYSPSGSLDTCVDASLIRRRKPKRNYAAHARPIDPYPFMRNESDSPCRPLNKYERFGLGEGAEKMMEYDCGPQSPVPERNPLAFRSLREPEKPKKGIDSSFPETQIRTGAYPPEQEQSCDVPHIYAFTPVEIYGMNCSSPLQRRRFDPPFTSSPVDAQVNSMCIDPDDEEDSRWRDSNRSCPLPQTPPSSIRSFKDTSSSRQGTPRTPKRSSRGGGREDYQGSILEMETPKCKRPPRLPAFPKDDSLVRQMHDASDEGLRAVLNVDLSPSNTTPPSPGWIPPPSNLVLLPTNKACPNKSRQSPNKSRQSPNKSRQSPNKSRQSPNKSRQSPNKSRQSPNRSRQSPNKSRQSPDKCRQSPNITPSSQSGSVEPCVGNQEYQHLLPVSRPLQDDSVEVVDNTIYMNDTSAGTLNAACANLDYTDSIVTSWAMEDDSSIEVVDNTIYLKNSTVESLEPCADDVPVHYVNPSLISSKGADTSSCMQGSSQVCDDQERESSIGSLVACADASLVPEHKPPRNFRARRQPIKPYQFYLPMRDGYTRLPLERREQFGLGSERGEKLMEYAGSPQPDEKCADPLAFRSLREPEKKPKGIDRSFPETQLRSGAYVDPRDRDKSYEPPCIYAVTPVKVYGMNDPEAHFYQRFDPPMTSSQIYDDSADFNYYDERTPPSGISYNKDGNWSPVLRTPKKTSQMGGQEDYQSSVLQMETPRCRPRSRMPSFPRDEGLLEEMQNAINERNRNLNRPSHNMTPSPPRRARSPPIIAAQCPNMSASSQSGSVEPCVGQQNQNLSPIIEASQNAGDECLQASPNRTPSSPSGSLDACVGQQNQNLSPIIEASQNVGDECLQASPNRTPSSPSGSLDACVGQQNQNLSPIIEASQNAGDECLEASPNRNPSSLSYVGQQHNLTDIFGSPGSELENAGVWQDYVTPNSLDWKGERIDFSWLFRSPGVEPRGYLEEIEPQLEVVNAIGEEDQDLTPRSLCMDASSVPGLNNSQQFDANQGYPLLESPPSSPAQGTPSQVCANQDLQNSSLEPCVDASLIQPIVPARNYRPPGRPVNPYPDFQPESPAGPINLDEPSCHPVNRYEHPINRYEHFGGFVGGGQKQMEYDCGPQSPVPERDPLAYRSLRQPEKPKKGIDSSLPETQIRTGAYPTEKDESYEPPGIYAATPVSIYGMESPTSPECPRFRPTTVSTPAEKYYVKAPDEDDSAWFDPNQPCPLPATPPSSIRSYKEDPDFYEGAPKSVRRPFQQGVHEDYQSSILNMDTPKSSRPRSRVPLFPRRQSIFDSLPREPTPPHSFSGSLDPCVDASFIPDRYPTRLERINAEPENPFANLVLEGSISRPINRYENFGAFKEPKVMDYDCRPQTPEPKSDPLAFRSLREPERKPKAINRSLPECEIQSGAYPPEKEQSYHVPHIYAMSPVECEFLRTPPTSAEIKDPYVPRSPKKPRVNDDYQNSVLDMETPKCSRPQTPQFPRDSGIFAPYEPDSAIRNVDTSSTAGFENSQQFDANQAYPILETPPSCLLNRSYEPKPTPSPHTPPLEYRPRRCRRQP